MADVSHALMLNATKDRSRRKKAFLRQLGTAKLSQKLKLDWDQCGPFQTALLSAELKVLDLAIAGIPISDFENRCKNKKKIGALADIAFELEQLFAVVASSPTKRFREYLHKPQLEATRRGWARGKIIKILQGPLKTFFEIADFLTRKLLDCIRKRQSDVRIRFGLNRTLMFISDCFRYSMDYAKSKDAAQLMKIISPEDPEAHMRLGLNLAMLGELSDSIHPFFHYCIFLANRDVSIGHPESVLVKKFVNDVASSRPQQTESPKRKAKRQFFCAFIQVLWSILSDDFQTAKEMVLKKDLWDSFSRYLDQSLSGDDMLDVVGAIIFTHYRTSPYGSPERSLLDQRRLSDILVGQFICIASEYLTKQLQELYNALRSRKKNRRRAMQKKRRADGTAVQLDQQLAVTKDVLKTMLALDQTSSVRGAISFLAHYWSKTRSASEPSADLKPLARTYKAVRNLEDELRRVEELICMVPAISHIDSKIIDDGRGVLPALLEDLKFCTFLPCKELQMFGHASLQEVPLPSFFHQEDTSTIKDFLEKIGSKSYESLVATTAQRHLEAFGLQCVKEVPAYQTFDKECSCALVSWTIRKFRIRRLSTDLEKVAGGTLCRMSLHSSLNSGNEARPSNEFVAESLPPAAQPLSAHPNNRNLHDQISPRKLDEQVRKRRRLVGNGTLPRADGSEVLVSSEELPRDVYWRGPQSNFDSLEQHEVDQPPRQHRLPTSRRRLAGCSSLPSSRGRLSQGTFELNYLPSRDEVLETSKPAKRSADCSLRLSAILSGFLYGQENARTTTLVPLDIPAPWRRAPSDDYLQLIFNSTRS